ncbi:MAG: hypothetical protein M3295_02515 [Chloroflexota bacterium]|nr:hypothetical protein [Chloroflexota bacterium]
MTSGGSGTIQVVSDLAVADGFVVAVGTLFHAAAPPEVGSVPEDGLVWRSTDGTTWEAVSTGDVFAGAQLGQLLVTPDEVLLFGEFDEDPSSGGNEVPRVWRSVDGVAWESTDVGLPENLKLLDLANGDRGHVITGAVDFGSAGHQIWFSPDGYDWEMVREAVPDDDDPFGHESYLAAGAGPEGFVVVGRTAGHPDEPVVLASSDGREWIESAPPEPLQVGEVFNWVAPLGADWVAIGGGAGGYNDWPVSIWSSADGLSWERTGQIETVSRGGLLRYASAFSSTGDGLFLSIGIQCCGFPRPVGVWSSTDGSAWDPVELGDAEVAAAVRTGDALILGGRIGVEEAEAAIWRRASE